MELFISTTDHMQQNTHSIHSKTLMCICPDYVPDHFLVIQVTFCILNSMLFDFGIDLIEALNSPSHFDCQAMMYRSISIKHACHLVLRKQHNTYTTHSRTVDSILIRRKRYYLLNKRFFALIKEQHLQKSKNKPIGVLKVFQ